MIVRRKVAVANKKHKINTESNNIALTGLMGTGKSSVGRTIARFLKRKFIDTDYLIEQKEGKSIKDIFSKKGEEYFRKIEREVIDEVFKEDSVVVSLGGGSIINDENRKLVKEKSTLITLIAEPEEIYERVKRRKHRPLLNDAEDQLDTLKNLWTERKKAYLDSHLQIHTSEKEIEDVAAEVLKSLQLNKAKSHKLDVSVERENAKYTIFFNDLKKLDLSSLNLGRQVLIISQAPVAKEYLTAVENCLKRQFKVHSLIIEDGEDAKNFFTYQHILQKCLELKFERKDTLIALGGGVVGDITGFAASTYYRGINYIQIPTTFLSMIDSSVGGKTAINVPEGKNLIGSFYQPHLVHIDVNNLKTLPESEFKSGLGELVKYTLLGQKWDSILGESFFSFINRNAQKIVKRDPEILQDTIDHCLKIKSNIIAEDEKEKGIRMHLNLGHTFGHAIEEITKYKRFSHGEAVAIGIACACYLSEELGCFKDTFKDKVLNLMDRLGLNYKIPEDISTEDIIKSCQYDKKVESGRMRFIAPKHRIGRVDILYNIDLDTVKKAIDRNR